MLAAENSSHIQKNETAIECVDNILVAAYQLRASDIHIEPQAEHYRIRFRIDGLLHFYRHIETLLAIRLIANLKVMANMDIAEKRLPQDGSIQPQNLPLDIRIGTYPQRWGEKLVLRLQQNITLPALHSLGFTSAQLQVVATYLKQPQGAIFITGPTGSGKTLTLYSLLQHLNKGEKNIVTIEDPIEIQLNGINQASVNPKIGLTFAKMLKGYLRQDPDIIMLGEMRDKASANIAMHAAMTGHQVFSTLHTNHAQDTLLRLESLKVPQHLLINALKMIISQRLIRKLCLQCKIYHPTTHSFHASGCAACRFTGYLGREGIFEILALTSSVLKVMVERKGELQQHISPTLQEAAQLKIQQGITSIAEIERVVGVL